MASCQGVLVLLNLHKADLALSSVSTRNMGTVWGTVLQNKLHSVYSWQVSDFFFFFLSLILLFKWLNKEGGCSCYQFCEKHSVSRLSEQLRCWAFQAMNIALTLELKITARGHLSPALPPGQAEFEPERILGNLQSKPLQCLPWWPILKVWFLKLWGRKFSLMSNSL